MIANLVTDQEMSRRAVSTIKNVLTTSQYPTAANRCFVALGRIDPAQAKTFFDTELGTVKTPIIRVAIIEASIVLDNKDDPAPLLRLAGDRDYPAVRSASLYVMAQEQIPQALSSVRELLSSHDDQSIRLALPAATVWSDAFQPDLLRLATDKKLNTEMRLVALRGIDAGQALTPEDLRKLSFLTTDVETPEISAMAASLVHPQPHDESPASVLNVAPARAGANKADQGGDNPKKSKEPWRSPEAIGAFLAALVAGIFSLAGLIISKEQKISEFRQSWIDAVRKDLARFIALTNRVLAHDKYDGNLSSGARWEPVDSVSEKISEIGSRLRLRLNPDEPISGELAHTILKVETMVKHFPYENAEALSFIQDHLAAIEAIRS